jgi:hypothetical protein
MPVAPALDDDLDDLALPDWLDRLAAIGDEHGYFERLGDAHACLFLDLSRTLLVTFETMEGARRLPDARPRALDLAIAEGWSAMAFLSDGETWFRDPAVWGTFDRLIDDGFFEDFDRVLFWGAGSGGYAACAYAVAAPGAQVLAYRPQATLAPSVAGWDRRFVADRRRDFTSRYGYAPDMIEGAGAVHVVHDPGQPMDAMHAALFGRENVRHYRVPTGGTRIDQMFDAMGIGRLIMQQAMAGSLNAVTFAQAWRARRTSVAYLRQLLRRLDADGRTGLIRSLCKHGLTTRDAPTFARRLAELEQSAAE